MPKWFEIAVEKTVLKRSLKVMLVVGTILTIINYGDHIVTGTLEPKHTFKIFLTYLVPFSVATYSTIAARLES